MATKKSTTEIADAFDKSKEAAARGVDHMEEVGGKVGATLSDLPNRGSKVKGMAIAFVVVLVVVGTLAVVYG